MFLIGDDNLLEKCDTILDKVSADIKKEVYSEPIYNKKNIYKLKLNVMVVKLQIFKIKKFLGWMDSNHTCLAVISLDSALKIDKNFYPYIIGDFESSFHDSDHSGEE